jgi:hypothetical protein
VPRNPKVVVASAAAGALALGVGVGIAGDAAADPTTTPSPNPSASAPADPGRGGPGGHHGGPGRGVAADDLAQQLADKLGVDKTKVADALEAIRDANRPATPPATPSADPSARPDPAQRDAELATQLADKLGIDKAKVTKALEEIRAARQAERAAALKSRLDAAVKAGTLTQAEADAVTKAVEKGVIGGR